MIEREVVVYVEVVGPDKPAIIRRGNRTWPQYLTPDMLAEIGERKRALYRGRCVDGVWLFGKREDLDLRA